jgi:hypothetical protein
VNVLAADKLIGAPRLYSTFLLWLLSELFEELPEIGDPEKPRLVFFFDEAHLLFRDAPKPLLEKVEQVVRLIRSKGVGVYFITQNPADVPETVLAQLGARIQHALRAYTPAEQKGLRACGGLLPREPGLRHGRGPAAAGRGGGLVSTLDEKGDAFGGGAHPHPAAQLAPGSGHAARRAGAVWRTVRWARSMTSRGPRLAHEAAPGARRAHGRHRAAAPAGGAGAGPEHGSSARPRAPGAGSSGRHHDGSRGQVVRAQLRQRGRGRHRPQRAGLAAPPPTLEEAREGDCCDHHAEDHQAA